MSSLKVPSSFLLYPSNLWASLAFSFVWYPFVHVFVLFFEMFSLYSLDWPGIHSIFYISSRHLWLANFVS